MNTGQSNCPLFCLDAVNTIVHTFIDWLDWKPSKHICHVFLIFRKKEAKQNIGAILLFVFGFTMKWKPMVAEANSELWGIWMRMRHCGTSRLELWCNVFLPNNEANFHFAHLHLFIILVTKSTFIFYCFLCLFTSTCQLLFWHGLILTVIGSFPPCPGLMIHPQSSTDKGSVNQMGNE